jgi:hypothetical protein
MSKPIINMLPKRRELDYCDGCQQLGEAQVSGIKRHRNLPLDTWLVELHCEEFTSTPETVLCANCIEDASKEEKMKLTKTDYYQGVKI